jgi:anaerobic magnesium-protoporphyrin IX monomethyl ester cyclase
MSEILFGQSYYLHFDPKLWEAMQPYPPLGTLYAASLIRSRGYSVALFDAMLAESEDEWAGALDRHSPRISILFEDNFNYLSKMCLLRMREAAFKMIAMARQRGCIVIVCSADATDHSEAYLAQGANFILLGEGEATLVELLDRLTGRTSTPLESIRGLSFMADCLPSNPASAARTKSTISNQKSEIINTSRRPDLKDLDSLPFPAWDLVDVARYREIWRSRHGYFSMNLAATRGCPYHCNWCAKPIWGQRYNMRSPENVVAEIKWLKDAFSPDHLWFVDDILGLKPGWLPRFADLIQDAGTAGEYRLPFKCLSRVDLLLRPGEIEALARAGCHTVWVGAESGSQKILDSMDKGTRVEQIAAAAERLHTAGIQVGFFLQFGYPGETRADIEKTLQLVRDCDPDDIGMSVSYPLPGTKFFEVVKEQLGDRQNWIDSNDLAMLYRGPFTTAFYRQLHIVLHKEFRARKNVQRLELLFGAFSACRRHTASIFVDARPPVTHRVQEGGRPAADPVGATSVAAYDITRLVASLFYNLATLPLARWKLDRLARLPHQGLNNLSALMTPEAAAQPTRQGEDDF